MSAPSASAGAMVTVAELLMTGVPPPALRPRTVTVNEPPTRFPSFGVPPLVAGCQEMVCQIPLSIAQYVLVVYTTKSLRSPSLWARTSYTEPDPKPDQSTRGRSQFFG